MPKTDNHVQKRSLASVRSQIAPFLAMDVLAQANEREAAGESIIHMEIGQPGTRAPLSVREAAKLAIDAHSLGYTEALGLPILRERIAQYYGQCYDIDLAPSRVIITTGSSAGFILAFLALLDVGSRLALPRPGYPCYRQIASALGIDCLMLRANAATGWMPDIADFDAFAEDEQPQALLLASPANPTGTMLSPDRLRELIALCESRHIAFISDEIYHGLDYAVPARTALSYSSNALIINSFSKYFSMTGWRIGWMVVPETLLRCIERLQQNLYISAPAISQYAALAAFDAHDELQSFKAIYRANRDLLLDGLPKAGFTDYAPADGAFYFYANISRWGLDGQAFALKMLDDIGVAVTPGVDFDAVDGKNYIRFSYAGETAKVAEAIERLKAWTQSAF